MTVRRTGDWAKARRLLTSAPMKMKGAITTSLHQEAHRLRKEIVQGLTKQAPGGIAIKDLSPLTLAARRLKGFGGTKALIKGADLRNAISVIFRGNEAFIGVPRKVQGKSGEPMVDIAELNEYGSDPIVIPITPAMSAFLAKLYKEAGIEPSEGSGAKVVVMQIPPRPFLRPAFEMFRKGADARFLGRVAGLLGMGKRK